MSSPIFAMAIAHYRALRAEYQLELEERYRVAEDATRGRLLNKRGATAGIDAISLFMGNETRALAYASEELVEHWSRFPRLTYAEFERQMLEPQELAA